MPQLSPRAKKIFDFLKIPLLLILVLLAYRFLLSKGGTVGSFIYSRF